MGVVPDVARSEGAVEQEHRAVGRLVEHVDALDELKLMAGDERARCTRYVDRIGCGPKRRCDVVREPDFFES